MIQITVEDLKLFIYLLFIFKTYFVWLQTNYKTLLRLPTNVYAFSMYFILCAN